MTMTKIIAAVAIAIATSSAHAWGPREQGIATGIAATLLWQHVNAPQIIVPAPPPVVVSPQYFPQHPPHFHRQYRPSHRIVDVYIPECNCYRGVVVPNY